MPEYRFLVADDDPAKRRQLSTIAAQESRLSVVEAVDGQHAFELIGTEHVLGAFIDYEMPGQLGPAVIAELRRVENQRGQTTKALIALTSGSSQQDFPQWREEAMAAGADDSISIHSLSNPNWVAELRAFAEKVRLLSAN